eukprot:scaffold115_cov304-Prasinococcus_capsulatus_cf.AAC.31
MHPVPLPRPIRNCVAETGSINRCVEGRRASIVATTPAMPRKLSAVGYRNSISLLLNGLFMALDHWRDEEHQHNEAY